jgi:hypothetical protein
MNAWRWRDVLISTTGAQRTLGLRPSPSVTGFICTDGGDTEAVYERAVGRPPHLSSVTS